MTLVSRFDHIKKDPIDFAMTAVLGKEIVLNAFLNRVRSSSHLTQLLSAKSASHNANYIVIEIERRRGCYGGAGL